VISKPLALLHRNSQSPFNYGRDAPVEDVERPALGDVLTAMAGRSVSIALTVGFLPKNP